MLLFLISWITPLLLPINSPSLTKKEFPWEVVIRALFPLREVITPLTVYSDKGNRSKGLKLGACFFFGSDKLSTFVGTSNSS